jgi:nitroreductase
MSSSASPADKSDNAILEYPVHELIANRRSGRAFSSQPVDSAMIGSLFEAARWAASCSNEQPWSFLLTEKQGESNKAGESNNKDTSSDHARLLSCLVQFNIEWAQHAPLLILSVARLNFAATGKPNRHALFDVGQASDNLALQATAMGLMAHQMAGFDAQKARSEFLIPEDHEPAAVIAVGYPGNPATLPEKLRTRDAAPRQRKPQSAFVFSGTWGHPATHDKK